MAPCVKSKPEETSSSADEADRMMQSDDYLHAADMQPDNTPPAQLKLDIVWTSVFNIALLHILSLYGFYVAVTDASWWTLTFSWILYVFGGLGITAGAHRLWSHKSYKAKTPLRAFYLAVVCKSLLHLLVFLMICQTLGGQDDIYKWSRDHRVHHKWSETNADPYNANRGMFFAHIGWLMVKKHPDVAIYGNKLNYDDLLTDKVVLFQKKHYKKLFWTVNVFMPSLVPWYFWGESMMTAYFVACCARYVFLLHMTWLVNSLAHYYGIRPYDKDINPAENRMVSLGALGEGFHNFHHSFPRDYQTSELGYRLNFTTMFIDLMYWCGLAYDLRTVSKEIIEKRKDRTGDTELKREFFRPNYGMKTE